MKLKIKLSNNDKNIIIPIGGVNNLLGYDDDVASLVENKTTTSINGVSDLEVKRFGSLFANPATFDINFFFWNGFGFTIFLAPLDFAANGLTSSSDEARNSFYIIQIFDTFDEATQTKLHTGYFNGYDFTERSTSGLSTVYKVNNDLTEFLNLYINNSFLEGKVSPLDVYAKFFFYSAQSGKFYPFASISTPTKQEDIYVKLSLNLNINSYTFSGSNINLFEITNPAYATSINDTATSLPVQKTSYPTGNTFTVDGNYTDQ